MTGGQITITLDLLQCLSTRNPTKHMPLNSTNNYFFLLKYHQYQTFTVSLSIMSSPKTRVIWCFILQSGMNIWSILNDNTILQQWNFTCSNSQIDLDSLHGWIMKLEIPASQSMMPSTKLRNYNHLSRDQILKLHKTKKLQTFSHRSNLKTLQIPSQDCWKFLFTSHQTLT